MSRTFAAAVAVLVLTFANLRGQDAKFAADNLKYSREFYAKVHFVAIAELPQAFKYDRYPSNGPERIQCDDGTYLRQHGKAWTHVNQPMRTGLPINYAENDRYIMNFAGKDEWGRYGAPVEKEIVGKLEGWIKLIDAAIHAEPAVVKLVEKSEADGRAQWVFETPNPNGAQTKFTFRRPIGDSGDNVLLHEFSGSMRLDGDKVVAAGAADLVRFGFGYMMNFEGGQEVSEFVWEEMQGKKNRK